MVDNFPQESGYIPTQIDLDNNFLRFKYVENDTWNYVEVGSKWNDGSGYDIIDQNGKELHFNPKHDLWNDYYIQQNWEYEHNWLKYIKNR